jgi:hypothetical protein
MRCREVSWFYLERILYLAPGIILPLDFNC